MSKRHTYLTVSVGCRILFASQSSGPTSDLSKHFELLSNNIKYDFELALFNGSFEPDAGEMRTTAYSAFISRGQESQIANFELAATESMVSAGDVVNLQFTSGKQSYAWADNS